MKATCGIRYGVACVVLFVQAESDVGIEERGLWAAHQYAEAKLCKANEPFEEYNEDPKATLKKIKFILKQERLIRFHSIELDEEVMPAETSSRNLRYESLLDKIRRLFNNNRKNREK